MIPPGLRASRRPGAGWDHSGSDVTGILSLDLSKTRTGFAYWQPGWEKPHHGGWQLGSEYTTNGGVFAKLHGNLLDLRQVMPFGTIYYEEPIDPRNLGAQTNIQTLRILSGLAAHTESFAHATGCRVHGINVSTWRKDFVGTALVSDAQAAARAKRKLGAKASATDKLKTLTKARCEQLGMAPKSFDEADAIGILDFALDFHEHITPPWRRDEVLRPPLSAGASR